MKKYGLIDLFAGCGGLTEGFERVKEFETLACVEWKKTACNTLINRLKTKWNYPDGEKRVLRFDIRRTEELLKGWNNDVEYGSHQGLNALISETRNVDLIIGGPPCQAYSIAGRIRDENGMRFDYRNYLFESYLKIVGYFRPKVVIFENVPGMLSAHPGNMLIVDRIKEAFDDIGYEIAEDLRRKALIDFLSFGVPQRRKRVIIFAIDRTLFKHNSQKRITEFYDRLLINSQVVKRGTVFSAIGDLPKFYPAEKDYVMNGKKFSHEPPVSEISNHVPRYHNKRDIEIFRELANDLLLGQPRYGSIDSIKQLYQERTGKTSNVHKYYVLRWNEPSNTIPAHLYKDGLRHIHPDPDQARSITPREAARIQTFGDDYKFLGSMGDQYRYIGNAVPPLFAEALASAIFKFLDE